jgi:hypothetical protein
MRRIPAVKQYGGKRLKIRQVKAVLLMAFLTLLLLSSLAQLAIAQQTSTSGDTTTTLTVDTYVDLYISDSAISFGTKNPVTAQRIAIGTDTYYIFDSQNDASAPNDEIEFNENTTNVNAFYYITVTGASYAGVDPTDWLYYKDASLAATADFVAKLINGTLTAGGAGTLTYPTGEAEVGSYSYSLVYYSSTDGDTWTRNTQTVYVALSNASRLYVDTDTDLTAGASVLTAKGDQATVRSNPFALVTAFPTATGQVATLRFGWYVAWDNTQANAIKDFYVLIEQPAQAPGNHQWSWTITINGEYHSSP